MRKIRNDIILIISLVIITIGLFIWWGISRANKENLYVNIYNSSELLYSVPIDQDREIIVEGKISEVKIIMKDSNVWVSESGCPDHICILLGKMNKKEDTITCLPNLIYIKIGEEKVKES